MVNSSVLIKQLFNSTEELYTFHNSFKDSLADYCESISFMRLMDVRESDVYWGHIAALVLLSIGVIGNLITIGIITSLQKLHTPTFTMLAMLAIEDLTGLILFYILVWTDITFWITNCHPKETARQWMKFSIVSKTVAMLNSAFHITLLCCIRYYIIVHPLRSKSRLSSRRVIGYSVMAWIISIIVGSIQLPFLGDGLRLSFLTSIIILGTTSALILFVPTVVIIVLHCLKVRALRNSPSTVQNVTRKMSSIISVILFIYILTSLTFPINCFADFIAFEVIKLFSLSYMFNFAINPLIYFFTGFNVIDLFSSCKV